MADDDTPRRKIRGYRELTDDEIALINDVKAWETQGRELFGRISTVIGLANATLLTDQDRAAFAAAEPTRWLNIGKTHIQQGCMAIVRAIARPN